MLLIVLFLSLSVSSYAQASCEEYLDSGSSLEEQDTFDYTIEQTYTIEGVKMVFEPCTIKALYYMGYWIDFLDGDIWHKNGETQTVRKNRLPDSEVRFRIGEKSVLVYIKTRRDDLQIVLGKDGPEDEEAK